MRSSLVPTKGLHPVGQVVEEIVLGQLELGYDGHRGLLGYHRESLCPDFLQPLVPFFVAK